jgi:acetyl esterase/lipase
LLLTFPLFQTDHYFASKIGSNSPEGRDSLNTDDFTDFLWPRSLELEPISDSPIAYHPPESERPNYPANPRMLLPRLYGERGLYLDYYTGSHAPSLTAQLRSIGRPSEAEDEMKEILGQHVHLFPQFADPKSFPPTFLIHGTADIAVLPSESRRMQVRLSSAGRECILREIEGQPHSFDNHPRKESFEELYDEAVDFLKKHLLPID